MTTRARGWSSRHSQASTPLPAWRVPLVRGGGRAVSLPGPERRRVRARRLLRGGPRCAGRRAAARSPTWRAACRPRFDPARSPTRSPSCSASARSASRRTGPPSRQPKIVPLRPVPLQTLVVNVTNQCNLACTYCYEYGEDKIVDTTNGQQPKFMSEETARESVEFALRESREQARAHHLLRRRDADELPGAEVDDCLRARSGPPRSARTSTSA